MAAFFLGVGQAPPGARPGSVTNLTPAAGNDVGRSMAGVTAAATGSSAAGLATLLTDTAQAPSDMAKTGLALSEATGPEDGLATDSAPAAPDANVTAAAALAHLAAATHTGGRDNNIAGGELRAPVGSPDWNHELSQQLTWMSQKGIDSASLRLSPAHLGPLEVQISVQNGAASVWFGASHADTRAALERALPELRQMFASQGLALTDSGVSREPPRDAGRAHLGSGIAAVGAIAAPATSAGGPAISLGLIDTYA